MVDGRDVVIEHGYQEPVATLLTLGDVREQPRWDYRSLGLGEEHVAELARLAVDPDFFWGDPESVEVWGPVHAWRALADLRAEGALDALVAVLSLPAAREDDDGYDEWIAEELPEVFATIGPAALPALATYLREPGHHRWARTTAAEAIGLIAARYPETRDEAVAVITEVVEATTQRPGATNDDDEIVNAFLISELLKLHAVESAPAIERAFAAERVDLTFVGDWEDAQVELGLRAERETPKRNYLAEKLFGDTSPEVLDLLRGDLDLGNLLGGPGFAGLGGDWSDPGFEPSFDGGPTPKGALTPAQVKQREGEAKRKLQNKRKMAEQSRKQNRKKKR